MTRLVLAAGQAAAVAGDLAANVATAARLAREAADRGVRLLVLPEAFLTGYDAQVFAGDLPDDDHLESRLDPLRTAAVEGGLSVVVGTARRVGPHRRLSQVVLTPDGAAGTPYDKQHLDGVERQHFEVGDHGASITVDGVELGLSICYDGCFPEHAHAAARDGALGYLASVAYFPGGRHRMELYYAARAVENGLYVVVAGLTGRCGGSEFIGGSAVYDPEGRPLVRLGEEVGLAVAELDTDLVAATRARHTMLADHRPDLGPRFTGRPPRR